MSNMSKIGKGPKNKLHFLWFVVVIVCVVTTHYYQKYKSTENYHKILEVASKRCDLETIKLLVKESRYTSSLNKETLYYTAEKGCLEIVKFLLDNGTDVDSVSRALFNAVEGGQLEVVKLLLKRGANPHVRGWKGKTPRAMAFKWSFYNSGKPYDEIIKLLARAEDQ